MFEGVAAALPTLCAETGLDLRLERRQEQPFLGGVAAGMPPPRDGVPSDAAVQAWLSTAANRMVNAFRPRLAALARAAAGA